MTAPLEVARDRREAGALGILGLARRAGQTAVGRRAVRDAGRRGRLRAVVLATDAAPSARDLAAALGSRHGVPVLELADRRRLGAAVGREPVAVLGVTDGHLAARLSEAAAGTVPGAGGEADPGRPRRGG